MMLPVVLLAAAAQAPPDVNSREWRTDFSRRTVALAEIVSGGPPKDGIPAIDRPQFESVAGAAVWLHDREPVVVVEIGEFARAYPLQILIWHEIVNDEVGGTPVAVTFCPLCNTALAFDRRLDGHVLDFGATGRLRHSDLVMYDRQTESWWQQATGEGIVGAYAGKRLRWLPAPLTSWRDFRDAYPAGRVLSRNTGHNRPYGRNPYERYDTRAGPNGGFRPTRGWSCAQLRAGGGGPVSGSGDRESVALEQARGGGPARGAPPRRRPARQPLLVRLGSVPTQHQASEVNQP